MRNCTSKCQVEESLVCPFIILLTQVINLKSLYLAVSSLARSSWSQQFTSGSNEVGMLIDCSLYRFY